MRFIVQVLVVGVIVTICMIAADGLAGEQPVRLGPPQKESRVPAWDARGLGPLPWQGIACADLSDDGRFIALGTIALPGDMNVFVLDENGKLLRQHSAGKRWINEVAAGDAGAFVAALCTTPTGQAGDRVMLSVFAGAKPEEINTDLPVFHYGANSNHLAPCVSAMGESLAVLSTNGVRWSTPAGAGKPSNANVPGADRAMAFAASTAGLAVVATALSADEAAKNAPNLFLLKRGESRPVCSVAPVTAVDAPPKMERGEYGPPAPPYEDLPVYSALSVAIDSAGKYFAAANYQGWERTFKSRGNFGVRFMPARPAICVYAENGAEARRFGPETFDRPFWCELAFSADGGDRGGRTRLFAWPHNWTARGLAGQTILPADDRANRLYALGVDTGSVQAVDFPDAIADLSVRPDGGAAVSCWNGRVYLLDAQLKPAANLAEGIDVGGPAIVDVAGDGRILAAGTSGVVRLLAPDGTERWSVDLNKLATPGDKPWTRNQQPGKIADGVWRTNGGLAHSDMGGQYVIEAPDGLIMIDPNGGLSFEQNWAKIAGAGFDPMTLRYVLLTHEHGDHSPAAYLWRVVTGALVVASKEVAYGIRHHLPYVSGYGFHPPIPADVVIDADRTIDLAGLQVQCIRLAGHTYGSMGWVFEKGGRRFVSIGDVIMPGGTLGYSGSLNFSAPDIMASMHKLKAIKPDYVLGGHGQGGPADFADKGIGVGEATGWAKMEPTKPDPFYAMKQRNYLIAAWRRPIATAAYPDVNADGRPDVAIIINEPDGPAIDVYLNHDASFREQPDLHIEVDGLRRASRLRTADINADLVPDFFVSDGSRLAVLVSQGGKPDYAASSIECTRCEYILPEDLDGDGLTDLVLGQRFVGSYAIAKQTAPGAWQMPPPCSMPGGYFGMQMLDVNGDGRNDLVASNGLVLLRQEDGSFADEPAVRLQMVEGWTFLAVADFNADKRPEIVLLNGNEQGGTLKVRVFDNTGNPQKPFAEQPARSFNLQDAAVLRDGPTIADWNADGTPDLVLCKTGRNGAIILLGGPGGITPERTETVTLDYVAHYDTKIGVADFNGDGIPDLASFGPTKVGVPAVYVWLQPKR